MKTTWILLLFGMLAATNLQALTSGTIRDRTNNEPLIGATIMLKSVGTGTVSDATGYFNLSAQPGDTLVFSYVGYISEERVVPPELVMNVALELGSLLREVLVTGYGIQKRKDVTGAILKVSSKEFDAGQPGNPLQQIQGKVVGLVITQPGGDPNGELTVRLRGAAPLEGQPPLLVIDGVAIEDFQRAITTLNPADVESYNILNDASAAAIYGSRGISGGTEKFNFRGSVGYVNLEGVMRGTGKEVYTARISAVQRSLNDKLQIRYGLNSSLTDCNFLPGQDDPSQTRTGGSFFSGGILLNYLPVWPLRRPDGSYYHSADQGFNPMFVLKVTTPSAGFGFTDISSL